jgi:hypothetical protein
MIYCSLRSVTIKLSILYGVSRSYVGRIPMTKHWPATLITARLIQGSANPFATPDAAKDLPMNTKNEARMASVRKDQIGKPPVLPLRTQTAARGRHSESKKRARPYALHARCLAMPHAAITGMRQSGEERKAKTVAVAKAPMQAAHRNALESFIRRVV